MPEISSDRREFPSVIPQMPPDRLAPLAKKHARYLSRPLVLETCLRLVDTVGGEIVEFGVASGTSTRVIRSLSNKTIYAFDSFEGLREAFENAPVGAFAGPVPDLPGVIIVKGYFEDTCTEELRARIGRVAFAHLDADLYSSTLVALRWLTPLLGNRSLILFDEFIGGDAAEARAFADWQAETGMTLLRIAEFDREPSGWGEMPDKRLLYQVVIEGPDPWIPSPGAFLKWTAKTDTFLKAKAELTAKLADSEKLAVRAGDVLSAQRSEPVGDHYKLFNVTLNGTAVPAAPWFIFPSHWGK